MSQLILSETSLGQKKVAVVEALNKSHCMDFLSAGMKKSGH